MMQKLLCMPLNLRLDYRMKFKRDVYIDLLGYRKYGHNEGDEPRFTQPKLYKEIAKHPNPLKYIRIELISEKMIDETYLNPLLTSLNICLKQNMLNQRRENSKVREFMEERWKGFQRKG